MKKFVLIVSMVIILIALIVFLSFTSIGKVVLVNSPFFKEKIDIEPQDFFKITYSSSSASDEINYVITNKNEVDEIINLLTNKKYTDYTPVVEVDFAHGYTLYFNNDIKVQFDDKISNEYAKITTKEKNFITKIDSKVIDEISKKFIMDSGESNRSREKVTVEVLKDTITPYGTTIVINDKNENPYNLEPIFSITKKDDNGWIYIPSNVDFEFDIETYYINGRQLVIKKLDWTKTHGKLSTGIYKITFQAKEENVWFSSNEFEIY